MNLTPGTFSSVGGHVNNLAIAFDTVIEKAIGGERQRHHQSLECRLDPEGRRRQR